MSCTSGESKRPKHTHLDSFGQTDSSAQQFVSDQAPVDDGWSDSLQAAKGIISSVVEGDSLQNELECQHASDELLSMWKTVEMKIFRPRQVLESTVTAEEDLILLSNQQTSKQSIRSTALFLLKELVAIIDPAPDMQIKRLFRSALYLDAHCWIKPDALHTTPLPTLCAAAVSIGMKLEDNKFGYFMSGVDLAETARDIMNHSICPASSEPASMLHITSDDVAKMECTLLSSLEWRLTLPATDSWIQLIISRLDIMTGRQFHMFNIKICQCAVNWASAFTFQHSVTADATPSQTASGLICGAAVAIMFLPASLFNIDECKHECLTALSFGMTVPQQSRNARAIFVAGLLKATESSLPTLITDVTMVCDVICSQHQHSHV